MKLEDHPTVKRIRLKTVDPVPARKESLDAQWLKQLVLDAGADDVGFVEIGRPALDDQREDILKAMPHTKSQTVSSQKNQARKQQLAPQQHWAIPQRTSACLPAGQVG